MVWTCDYIVLLFMIIIIIKTCLLHNIIIGNLRLFFHTYFCPCFLILRLFSEPWHYKIFCVTQSITQRYDINHCDICSCLLSLYLCTLLHYLKWSKNIFTVCLLTHSQHALFCNHFITSASLYCCCSYSSRYSHSCKLFFQIPSS